MERGIKQKIPPLAIGGEEVSLSRKAAGEVFSMKTGRNGRPPADIEAYQIVLGVVERLLKAPARLSKVDERLSKVDERLSKVDERLSKVDERLSKALKRLFHVLE